MHRYWLAWTLALLLGSAAPAAALSNGGFETGSLLPWFQGHVFSGGEDWNVTSVDAHSGAFSATNTGNKEIRQNFDPIPVDGILELSFFAKHQGPGLDIAVSLYFDVGQLDVYVATTASEEWEFFDVTGSLGLVAGRQLVGFGVYGNEAGSYTRTFLDDVLIRVVPEPSTAALLLLGLAALGVRRR